MQNTPNPLPDEIPGPNKTNTSNDSTSEPPLMSEDQISGSMHTEEPTGWDQAPQAISDPRQKRHPRPDGKGGIDGDTSDQRAGDKM